MKLVYLSPVALDSFEQRPHYMVRELLRGAVTSALWLEPYPTRLPRFADLRRPSEVGLAAPDAGLAIKAIRPKALPIEPLQFGRRLNSRMFFRPLIGEVDRWLGKERFILAIGKPSPLAIALLDRYQDDPRCAGSLYDRMDRFAAFHSGISARAMQGWEDEIVRRVNHVQAASTSLLEELKPVCRSATICLNGFDEEAIAAALAAPEPAGTAALGYVGTLGTWFDWSWLGRLAEQLDAESSNMTIRLIGPCFHRPSHAIPQRVSMEPALPHAQALRAMRSLEVGLIPFRTGGLTDGVDPIKYYEYRALGLPVVGTSFGELRHKTSDPALFLADAANPLAAVRSALAIAKRRPHVSLGDCTWKARFAPLVEWLQSRKAA